jgi:hypothetical protein
LQSQEQIEKPSLEDPELLVKHVLDKHGIIHQNQITSSEMRKDAYLYANREMTEGDYYKMKKKYSEKIFLNLFFEGSKSLMELTEKSFSDQKFETEMIKKGIHPLIVSEEEAKIFHSKEYGTHSPVISTHHIKIGTPHGISRTEVGLLSDLYKCGYLTEITPEALIAYALEERKRIIRVDTARKICKEINKQRREEVSARIDGRIGEDHMTKKSLEIISKRAMAEGWSYEKVNNYGNQARKLVKLMNDDFGKEIGNMITKQNSDNKEELAVNHMDHLCKTMGIAMEDMLAVAYYKIMGRKKKK